MRPVRTLIVGTLLALVLAGCGDGSEKGIVRAEPDGGAKPTAARLVQLLEWVRISHSPQGDMFDEARGMIALERFRAICEHENLPKGLDRGCTRGLAAAASPWMSAGTSYADALTEFGEVISTRERLALLEDLEPDPDIAGLESVDADRMELLTTLRGVIDQSPRPGADLRIGLAWLEVLSSCAEQIDILIELAQRQDPLDEATLSCAVVLFSDLDDRIEAMRTDNRFTYEYERDAALEILRDFRR